MPTYDYQCTSCGHQFEAFHRISELLTECPVCAGKVEKRIGAGIGLIFKGSGFYITDYKNGSKSDSETKPKSDSTPEKKNGTQDNKNGSVKKDSGK